MEAPLKISNGNSRIQSVDILRGLVMVIMAIDHVRVYSGQPAGGAEAGIFFTRWITHYCAPAFAFFAGTSAFLYLKKTGSKNDTARFLITRGLLLVLLEITVIRFFWTFNLDLGSFVFAGVIWMLGWCMVSLAPMMWARPGLVGVIGVIMIFIQQVFHFIPLGNLWEFFYPAGSGASSLSGPGGMTNVFGISILYVLIPWIGVMMAGFGFGELLQRDAQQVRKLCLWIGFSAIGLFIVAGTVMIMMNPEGDQPFIFKLLGQRKYPPSQLYLLMTLGPIIALVPWAEKIRGGVADALRIVGSVPMFYYLLHIILIHVTAWIVNIAMDGTTHQEWYETAPLVFVEDGQRWGLPLLYLVWAADLVILYFACRWYAAYKAQRRVGWVKYV